MRIISDSVSYTIKTGSALARNLKPGDIICLSGNLGSGKTVLTKGIAQGLGVARSKVISPSFVLLREHMQGKLPLYHFDLYRLSMPEDILALGYEEYFYGSGVTVIEWAERLKYLLPSESLSVELSIKGGSRRVLKFSAKGLRYRELLKRINEDIRD